MISPVKEFSSAARSAQETAETTLAEMRDSVAALAKEVADIAERRTRAARQTAIDTAEAGASELRRTHPPSAGARHGRCRRGGRGAGPACGPALQPSFEQLTLG